MAGSADSRNPSQPLPNGTIIDEPVEVASWLAREMGLSVASFDEACERARLEWGAHTEYDPPSFPGTVFWGTCVRYLRGLLVRLDWTPDDTKNFSRIIHPDGDIALVVETGDEFTGVRGTKQPKTKSAKGTETLAAIVANVEQVDMFIDPAHQLFRAQKNRLMRTYFLLVRLEGGRVYREVSLPVRSGENDRIDTWHIRVLLPPLTGGTPPGAQAPLPLPAPDPIIEVTRRTA